MLLGDRLGIAAGGVAGSLPVAHRVQAPVLLTAAKCAERAHRVVHSVAVGVGERTTAKVTQAIEVVLSL